jgi:hypothetical protein
MLENFLINFFPLLRPWAIMIGVNERFYRARPRDDAVRICNALRAAEKMSITLMHGR